MRDGVGSVDRWGCWFSLHWPWVCFGPGWGARGGGLSFQVPSKPTVLNSGEAS